MTSLNTQSSAKHAAAPLLKPALVALTVALLSACTGGGPENSPVNQNSGNNNGSNYSGPPPQTDDVQRFQTYFWNNVLDKCGDCHNEGGQSPTFARQDDINLAYAEANTVADLSSPADSRLVIKVGSGHNCWLPDNQACADTMTSYITNWAGDQANSSTEIVLTDPPNLNDPGATKNFPEDPALFQTYVYPLLTQYCADCHRESAATPISPFFASNDIDVAYAAAQSRMNLDTPADSRFVTRLRAEFHNCWDVCEYDDPNLVSDSDEMEAAITQFSDAIPVSQLDEDTVASKAMTLYNGILASSGGRYEADAIATWQFKAGELNTAYDTSGVEPALPLTLNGDFEWVGGWGINLKDGSARASTANSKKLHDLIKATNEYTIEGWFAPANVTQEGPARIVSYSGGETTRNFMLGQTLYNYDFLNRSTNSDANGEPGLSTADADERLQATLQHVAVTYDPINGRRIYVNGEYTGDVDGVEAGTLNDWDDTYILVLGAETNNDFKWSGVIKFLSIHNRALNLEQIQQNFNAGVGERFYLLFNISQVINPDDEANNTNEARAYIVFEAAQWDSYSYLFNAPYFLSLNPDFSPSNIPLKGMSIGINGKENNVGQAYRNLDMVLDAADYSSETGQVISTLGTVIGLEQGPAVDEFFLTFEQLGDKTNVRVDADPTPVPTPPDANPVASEIGVRTFEEVYATLAQMTGVSMNSTRVRDVYLKVKQQLPTKEGIESFLSSHQMGVTQLTIEYCSAWMEDTTLRAQDFPGFDFNGSVTASFDSAGRTALIDPLLVKIMGTNLTSQPADNDVRGELNDLIDTLTACGGSCEAGRTLKVAKSVCAAAAGSAVMLVQ
ncbi:MAG: LamG domain-containing protein [Gammaproteobacteria bacterium]|nr:LamG domain-containing protein [Gammaproteobacteria bacterium]NVK88777.1 LamG domain-containing protein [Gammaproteobacteria bacterium]